MNTLIYLIGVFLAYYFLRKHDRKVAIEDPKDKYTWNTVFVNITVSLFSWAAVALVLCIMYEETIIKVLNKINSYIPKKPPHWL